MSIKKTLFLRISYIQIMRLNLGGNFYLARTNWMGYLNLTLHCFYQACKKGNSDVF